jgi:hypothetical protein
VTSMFERHHHGPEKAANIISRLEGRKEKVSARLTKRPLPRCPEVAAMDQIPLIPQAATSPDVVLPSSEPPIPVDYIPAEMFLETIGFFSTVVKLTREAPKAVLTQKDTPLNHDECASTSSASRFAAGD